MIITHSLFRCVTVVALVVTALCISNMTNASPTPKADIGQIDLAHSVIVDLTAHLPSEKMAARMLTEEIARRTHIAMPLVQTPLEADTRIVVGTKQEFDAARISYAAAPALNKAEGFAIQAVSASGKHTVKVVGADSRGVLFGVGCLLRTVILQREHVLISEDISISSSPSQAMRGHQLGYRPKTNSYDGWTIAMWEQYFRDLIVFGTNAIELIPPRSDDAADSPMFPEPPMRMMEKMSALLDDYGLDVWVWFPAMDADYTDAATVDRSIAEWADVLKRLKRVDAIFVPGGDPGHTDPDVLMHLLGKQAVNIHAYHPKAKLWVSPQGFTEEWTNRFLGYLKKEQPTWFGGVVFGPQVRMPLPELRKQVPPQYPIRHYPDITHMVLCQFPVENWDMAWALTEGREGINPRPEAQAIICKWHQNGTVGSISYSEGCNDDVNKMLWSALEWNPNQSVRDILREYARYFIDSRFEESFADGLIALEQNWVGPADTNPHIQATLGLFQAMERQAMPGNKLNWRFQQALYRAYYDAVVQARAKAERAGEAKAIAALAAAHQHGALKAVDEAGKALAASTGGASVENLKANVARLAEALFQSIHMQLSVKQYYAIGAERGANLDQIDVPVNDSIWLRKQFAGIRALRDDAERLRRIDMIVHWEDAGQGGYYDLLSDPMRRPHLITGAPFADDPGHLNSVRIGHNVTFGGRLRSASWAETLYDVPMKLHYAGLKSGVNYRVRVVYGTDVPQVKIKMEANGVMVHDWLTRTVPAAPVEFALPAGAVKDGELALTFRREPGLGGNGRGCQVSEIWLLPAN